MSIVTDPSIVGSYFAESALYDANGMINETRYDYDFVVRYDEPEDLFKQILEVSEMIKNDIANGVKIALSAKSDLKEISKIVKEIKN